MACATRSRYQNETLGELRSQAIAPTAPATRFEARTRDPDDQVNGLHRGRIKAECISAF